eukprot:932032-Pleurochrysis_carterae.AAC.1
MGIASVANVCLLEPCRRLASRLCKCAAARRRPESRSPAEHGSSSLRSAPGRPAGTHRRTPIFACACQQRSGMPLVPEE